MKTMLLRTAAILVAAVLFLCPVSALSAEKAIVLDAATGRALYEKHADDRSLIASTTKIMTALIICQRCNVLDRVKIPAEAVGVEGSSMYLKEGEVLTVQELLYGLMLRSGNDAAEALAIYCGGTVEGFAELMNDKARELGLRDTHFVNPHGLDAPGHHSTARDLAVLSAYAMADPIFARTVGAKSVTVGERVLTNHNKLLWQLPGCEGIKTGYTKAAGRILVSSASREGRRLICVTINAPDDWNDHKALLEDGFSRYEVRRIVEAGEVLGYRHILGGDGTAVPLIAAEEFSYALAEGEEPELVLSPQSFSYAPVRSGEEEGVAYVVLEGEVIGQIPLVWGSSMDMKQEKERTWLSRLFGGI
ncbi:MAG: D-alanyl-D-alanine carboxypeptidase [Oscillospiraceae bacterium]|nr:D-alanyl-D-alanine carboxypeptidase [Oscillospiraceae bacterium]